MNKYNYVLYEWYNPVFVILCYNELFKKYPGQEGHYLFKKAKEAMQGAMSLLGARKLHEDNAYIMQMNRQFQRPDVIAATYKKINGFPTIKISPLEITEMEEHTNHQNLSKFIIDTKLKKNYTPETIFICMVNKVIQYNIHDIAGKIKSVNKINPIYIVGKALNPVSTSFTIASPQPIVAKVGFDLVEQGRNYPYPFRMTLHEDRTNMNPVMTPHAAKPIDLFEFFMLNGMLITKKFDI
ncbi:hypothetical protein MUP32_06695 [Candidatus Microgenomates bacterium]|nr:hypothetical protein [Candidatus Microgenomates bacterium]